MENPADIIAGLRNEVTDFERQVQEKMTALAKEGLLTDKDGIKIKHNMQATVEALSKAFTTQSSDQAFTKEWISRIVQSYKEEIIQQIKEIENRRYTDKFIANRIQRIIEQSFAGVPALERGGSIDIEIKKLERLLWEDIRGISQKHSRRAQLIETWLQEFESNVHLLTRPRIDPPKGR